jgi:hypothetical protein
MANHSAGETHYGVSNCGFRIADFGLAVTTRRALDSRVSIRNPKSPIRKFYEISSAG